jgi:hypothetical protein
MFDSVDRLYGDYELALKGGGGAGGEEGGEAAGGAGGGGGFGGGSIGGEDLDFGDEAGGEEEEVGAEAGGDEFGAETPEAGAPETAGLEPEAGAPETVAEKVNRVGNLLKEEKHILGKKLEHRTKKYQDIYFNRLVESMRPNKEIIDEKIKLYDKNVKINEDISNMIKGIDKILDE